jgi:hypothetical protein
MNILLPLMIHSPSLSRASSRVASGVRLGETEGGEDLAAAEPREPLALLLVVAEVEDGANAERVRRRHGRRSRAVHARELLDGDNVGDVADVAPAVLLGDEHTEEAELGHFLHEIEGELLFFVQLLGDRLYLLLRELAYGIPEYLLLLGEIVIQHVRPFFTSS